MHASCIECMHVSELFQRVFKALGSSRAFVGLWMQCMRQWCRLGAVFRMHQCSSMHAGPLARNACVGDVRCSCHSEEDADGRVSAQREMR
jgi:hypothetical protein